MRPDNTPVDRAAPIGRVNWFSSVVVPALVTSNVSELAASLTEISNFAIRLTDVSWAATITDAAAQTDMGGLSDMALLTIPQIDQTLNLALFKPNVVNRAVVTNAFAVGNFGPSNGDNPGVTPWQAPFIPLSPMIFRVIDGSGNDSAAVSWVSHVSALIYTIEQFNRGEIWRTQQVTF